MHGLIHKVTDHVLGEKSISDESTYRSKASGVKGDGLSDSSIVKVLRRILICNLARLIILDADGFIGLGQRALDHINKSYPLLTGFSTDSFEDLYGSDTIQHSTFPNGVKKLLNPATTSSLQSKLVPTILSSSIALARQDGSFSDIIAKLIPSLCMDNKAST